VKLSTDEVPLPVSLESSWLKTLAQISSKMRQHYIRILAGDRVTVKATRRWRQLFNVVFSQARPQRLRHTGPLREAEFPGAEVRDVHARARPLSHLRFIGPAIIWAIRAPTVEDCVFEHYARAYPFDINSQTAYLNRLRFRERIRLMIQCASRTTATWSFRAVSQLSLT